MANPQAEDGHVDLANEIVEEFYNLQLSGNQWRLLWVIIRQTYGWHKKTDRISISFFERRTRLKRRHVVRALNDMVERKIITKNDTTFISTYGFQKDYSKWDSLPKKTCAKNGNGSLPKMTPTKEIKETTQKKDAQDALLTSFKTFYQAYPKHKARKKAGEAWNKLNPDDALFQTIMATLEKQKNCEDWKKEKGKYIPHPATWLSGERWKDEIPEVKAKW